MKDIDNGINKLQDEIMTAEEEDLRPLNYELTKEENRLRSSRMAAAASASTPEAANNLFKAMVSNQHTATENVERTETEKNLIRKIKEVEAAIAKKKEAVAQLQREGTEERTKIDKQVEEMRAKSKQLNADCDEKLEKISKDLKQKWVAEQDEFYKQGIEKYLFPVGSEVMFEWLVYPDGNKFELKDASNITFGKPVEPMTVSYMLDLVFDR